MLKMLMPIAVIVISNTCYNICAKSTPGNVNSFASLFITYGVATLVSLIMFFVMGGKNIFGEFAKTNWTSWVLGIAIVGLEFGWLLAYRSGWKISFTNLIASIALACVLLVVGYLFFKETLSAKQIIGIGISLAGMILIIK